MPNEKKKPGDKEAIALRELESLKFRLEGYSFRDIGRKLLISHTMAQNDVNNVIAAETKDNEKNILRMREIENQRIDALWKRSYEEALKDNEFNIAAFMVCDRLARRRAALNGLDMPVKVSIDGNILPLQQTIYVLPEREMAEFEVVEPTNGENGKELTDGKD